MRNLGQCGLEGVGRLWLRRMGEGTSPKDGEGTPRQSQGGRTDLPPRWSQDPDGSLDPLPLHANL